MPPLSAYSGYVTPYVPCGSSVRHLALPDRRRRRRARPRLDVLADHRRRAARSTGRRRARSRAAATRSSSGVPATAASTPSRRRFNARTRVHEYGGGAFTVHDGTVFFCHDDDQRIYRARARRRAGADHAEPRRSAALRRPARDARRALARVRARARRRARARQRPRRAPDRRLGGAAGDRLRPRLLLSSPRVSPDGTQIAWLAWDHPRMPWEGCELWVRLSGRASGWSPAARPRRSCSPSGARTASCTTARTAPAGGTSTAARTASR